MGLKKITSKKLENGDTFATRIENKESAYFGQYLIFICFKDDFWFDYWGSWYDESKENLFRIKITQNFSIPNSKEEIDSLDYVISKVKCIEEAYYPLIGGKSYEELVESRSFQTLYPDEYGYLNEYLNVLWNSRGNKLPEFIYLGNFDLESPSDEFIPFGCDMHGAFYYQIIADSLKNYENYNCRRSELYSLEGNKSNRKIAKQNFEFDNKNHKLSLKKEKIKILEKFDAKSFFGSGVGLYDNDIALEVKSIYLDIYDEKKNNTEFMNELLVQIKNHIDNPYNGTIAWMTIADLQIDRNRLDQKLKNIGLKCLKLNLSNWEGHKQYLEREKELNKLKEKIEGYPYEKIKKTNKIGIRFEIPNEKGTFLKKIFSGINIIFYNWNIVDEDIIFDNGFCFEDDVYKGTDMKKILDEDMYLVFANMQLVRGNFGISYIDNYEDFLDSECEILLLIVDSSYVDIYLKNEDEMAIIKDNVKKNNFRNMKYIYDDDNPRNVFHI